MPQPAASLAAAARGAARAPDAGRRHPADLARLLGDDVDQLQRLESLQARSASEHDRKVALVERIAATACELRAHYRGPSSTPCRAPRWCSADGTQAVW